MEAKVVRRKPGRPRKSAQSLVRLQVLLGAADVKAVDAEAAKEGISRSEWIRKAVREKLAGRALLEQDDRVQRVLRACRMIDDVGVTLRRLAAEIAHAGKLSGYARAYIVRSLEAEPAVGCSDERAEPAEQV